MTALHWLCASPDVSPDAIIEVLGSHIAAASVAETGRQRLTPLHQLCRNPAVTCEHLEAFERGADTSGPLAGSLMSIEVMPSEAGEVPGGLSPREPGVHRAVPPGELGRQARLLLEADQAAGRAIDSAARQTRRRHRKAQSELFLRPASGQPRLGASVVTARRRPMSVAAADRLVTDRLAEVARRGGKQQRRPARPPGGKTGGRLRGKYTSHGPPRSAPKPDPQDKLGTLGTSARFPTHPSKKPAGRAAAGALNFAGGESSKAAERAASVRLAADVAGGAGAGGVVAKQGVGKQSFWAAVDHCGRTPVHDLCSNPRTTEACLLFTARTGPAGWLARDADGRTPLDILASVGRLWGKLLAGLVLVSGGVLCTSTVLLPQPQPQSLRDNTVGAAGPLHWLCKAAGRLDGAAVRSLLQVDEPALAAVASDGRTPLHWLTVHPDYLQTISLQTGRQLHSDVVCRSLYFAAAAAVPDIAGDTPLHLLCRHRAVSSAAIRAFVEAAPLAATVTNHLGRLPLHHLAATDGVTIEALRACTPYATAMTGCRDQEGTSPLEVLLSNPTREADSRDGGLVSIPGRGQRGWYMPAAEPAWLRLRYAADHYVGLAEALYGEGRVEAGMSPRQTNWDDLASPLHWLCKKNFQNHRLDHQAVAAVLAADEPALGLVGSDGQTALHWLLKHPDLLGSSSSGLFVEVVCESLHFATAASVPDSAGNTPMHLLCRHPAASARVVKAYLEKAPLVAQIANKLGARPVHCLPSEKGDGKAAAVGARRMRQLLENAGAELVEELSGLGLAELRERAGLGWRDRVAAESQSVAGRPANEQRTLVAWLIQQAAAAAAGVSM